MLIFFFRGEQMEMVFGDDFSTPSGYTNIVSGELYSIEGEFGFYDDRV